MKAYKLDFAAWTAIISDLPCQEEIARRLAQMEIRRTPPEKLRLIRTAWESLRDKNLLSVGNMVVEYTRIQLKESSLPRREREFVSTLVGGAIYATVEQIKAGMEAEKTLKAVKAKRKSRTKKTTQP